MHLSEGVLHSQTLIVGAVVAVVGIVLGLKRLQSDRLSLTALFAAAFFVASTIHIPVGIGSVHLILNGVAAIFLGWAVFPAFLIALVLQALLFSFGVACVGRALFEPPATERTYPQAVNFHRYFGWCAGCWWFSSDCLSGTGDRRRQAVCRSHWATDRLALARVCGR